MYYYALDCGSAIYCGKTEELQIRLMKHANGEGAKFTRANPPKKALFWFKVPDGDKRTEGQFARYVSAITNKAVSIGAVFVRRSIWPRFELQSFDEWNGLKASEVPY